MKFFLSGSLIALFLLAGCARTPDETRIRDAISTMQAAVQERQPRAFMDELASDFSANNGSVDREQMHNVLRAQLLRNEKIGVTLGPIEVQLLGERATAEFSATLTGGAGGWLPERGAVYTISSGWKREDGDWRCINATWAAR